MTVYPAGSNGDVPPIATIGGSNTGLYRSGGIAVDESGKIYIANGQMVLQGPSSVTVYAAGSNGNVGPIQTITGPDTQLNQPYSTWGIAVK